MAYTEVVIGGGGALKPYFTTSGARALVGFTQPANRLSADGAYCALTEYVGMPVSGGNQQFFVADSGGGNLAASGAIDPPGAADASAARTDYVLSVVKAVLGGGGYWVGVINNSGTGVGFLRTNSGSTSQFSAAWGPLTGWTGTMNVRVGYNIVPDAPTGVTVVAGANPGEVVVSWAAPADVGGTAVNGYRVAWSTDSFATTLGSVADTGDADLSYTVTGLTEGLVLKFRVAARNAVSDAFSATTHSGPWSSASATVTVPGSAGGVQVYNGTASVDGVVSVYDGADSVVVAMKVFDGTGSVDLN